MLVVSEDRIQSGPVGHMGRGIGDSPPRSAQGGQRVVEGSHDCNLSEAVDVSTRRIDQGARQLSEASYSSTRRAPVSVSATAPVDVNLRSAPTLGTSITLFMNIPLADLWAMSYHLCGRSLWPTRRLEKTVTTTWMLLAVPAVDYAELKHMVNFRQEQRGEAPSPTPEELSGEQLKRDAVIRAAFDEHEAWPHSALERLAAATTITTDRFSQAMDICVDLRAENPAFPLISTTGLAERSGMSVEEWRAACRKINAHMEKHYTDVPRWPVESRGAGRPFWPLVNISGRSLGVHDQLYVGITELQAERWKKVRSAR